MYVMGKMAIHRQIVYGLVAIAAILFLVGCAEKKTTKISETPKQQFVKVTLPIELATGPVFLITQKKFKGSFSLYPIGALELGEKVDAPEGTTHVLVNNLSESLIGHWNPEGIFTDNSDLGPIVVLDRNGNSLFLDSALIDILDIPDIINIDDFSYGWPWGKGCCTMCVTRPDGSQMCFSVCKGCS
jgi:hypothetical protein